MKQVGFQKSLPEFMDSLRNDPKFFHETPEALLEDFKDIVENKIGPNLKKIFTKDPEHALV